VSDDLFALSTLVQWLWRARIRNHQPVKLYIPSERMRDLFDRWLMSDSTPSLVREIAGREIAGGRSPSPSIIALAGNS
jgi:hypothetical protein